MHQTQTVTRSEAAFTIINAIKEIYDEKGSCIVAIDGNSGAGKSTLGAQIAAASHGTLLHTDDFFLPPKLRTEERLKIPGGNIDYDRFCKEIITGISSGKSFNYRAFSCKNGEYSVKRAKCAPIYIIEGVYSLHPKWQENIDLKVFMSVSYDTQVSRILSRNGSEMLKNFTDKWIPLENMYFEHYNISKAAHIIVFS